MRARLERSLRRLGAAGVLGIGVLLAGVGFYLQALAPLERTVREERATLERLRARTSRQPASARDAQDLAGFYALFPSTAGLGAEVERLHAMARKNGLELLQGEYRLEQRPEGLWAYRITLPVRGGYGQFRAFLSAVLTGMPVASIDALRFERKQALDTQLEAQIRMTVYVRPAGDLP